ncbi:uncharacterized membrane protein YuzA (DUF378 family) [Conyzicola lurida]|uniref:Uncharacterized membrane protein YuzA (DUF378 family) n=1 Tax=Conyzicola lurida TaxID=1172621 RepID=A0A841AQI0_9MICO|nr:hypothetical protein [Conyzicola lurida]MBB5844031.1 uncharacterized membrane protein YuzA (DUF378 family) [Conyzicola lurida]
MTDNTTTEAVDGATTRRRFGVLGATVAILFGLLYAYDLWEAINNAIELPKAYEQIAALGVDVGEVPWTLIIVGIAIPPLVYLAALVFGRRRNAFGKAVYFAVGLALVAVLSLDIIALA